MVKSRVWLSLVSLILLASLVLAGCTGSSSKTPQEALQSSLKKSAELKSYRFEGRTTIEALKVPTGEGSADTAQMLSMLADLNLSWTGVYRADPMHMEMTLTLSLKGDLAIDFNIPIVMEQDKVWVKIPNIPFLPLPDDITGKFLELDLKQLAKESGQAMPSIDPGQSQKFANELMGIIFKNIDETAYLTDVKVKDAGLPDGVDVKQVIRFQVGKDQVEPFVNTVVEKIAPEIINLLLSHAEYRDMLGLKQEDLDEAKKALEDARKDDISKGMDEFKQAVKSLDVTANIGIDAKDYPVYTDVHVSVEADADGQPVTVAFKIVSQTKDINKDVELKYDGGPKAEDVLTMEQFQQQLGGLLGGIEGL